MDRNPYTNPPEMAATGSPVPGISHHRQAARSLEVRTAQQHQRQRLLRWLFSRLGVRVKEPCARCGLPYLVERPRFNPDLVSLCPSCKPRPDRAPNAALRCDCGQPTAVVVYLAIYHPESPQRTAEPTPLCETCAIDELIARIQGQV